MNAQKIHDILSTSFDPVSWNQVLREVFGARVLHQTPQPIKLPANDLAEKAVELGHLNTSDDRIVGLYQVDLTDKPQIWRNRVGLRSLLKNVYTHDVDAALVVFVQGDKWRLSLISEIRILKDDGTIEAQETQPKRFTYVLGSGSKALTAAKRIDSLFGKKYSLEEIRSAFSVEALNKEFYEKVSKHFYKLVGATEGKGKKSVTYERQLLLPSVAERSTKYQEFAVRLIGRLVFCWFLKEKMSKNDKPLIPGGLVESKAVQKNYYHSILEPLFFQTLNTPMDSRISGLPKGCEDIPFLNGGLFEPHADDHYELNNGTGISNHLNTLKIPDDWFREFFATLEEYNFTIDENSPVDVEISIDPEMLGRIFENLLAQINPETGESARKATGSFYTPREIVNYMVDESLILYLKGKLNGRSDEDLEKDLRELFSYNSTENPFADADTQTIIEAIDECKILDPACGSGAFPIGILQRLVFLLGKLDPDEKDGKKSKWRLWQEAKAKKEAADAIGIVDKAAREERLKEISDIFELNASDFGRKLFLIENCIYGVDIQPIAAEISKLRCFLTLIVDETIDDKEENRGVKPLPNLEFKFVTADSLLKLPEADKQADLFNSEDKEQLERLARIRHEYMNSSGRRKEKLKEDFQTVQEEIYQSLIKNSTRQNPRAVALSTWKPFDYSITNWFDPAWMFGVKEFDVVIGNPPYGAKLSAEQIERYKRIFHLKTTETAILFIERGHGLLKNKGTKTYIVPKSFSFASNYSSTRDFLSNELRLIADCGKAFENVKLEACIILTGKGSKTSEYHCKDPLE